MGKQYPRFFRDSALLMLASTLCCVGAFPAFAQNQDNASSTVAAAAPVPPPPVDKEAQLQQQLDDINLEIKGLGNTITGLKGEGQSLGRDISLLSANIDKANLNIKAKNLQLSQLSQGITEKSRTVVSLSKRLDNEKQSLAQQQGTCGRYRKVAPSERITRGEKDKRTTREKFSYPQPFRKSSTPSDVSPITHDHTADSPHV